MSILNEQSRIAEAERLLALAQKKLESQPGFREAVIRNFFNDSIKHFWEDDKKVPFITPAGLPLEVSLSIGPEKKSLKILRPPYVGDKSSQEAVEVSVNYNTRQPDSRNLFHLITPEIRGMAVDGSVVVRRQSWEGKADIDQDYDSSEAVKGFETFLSKHLI